MPKTVFSVVLGVLLVAVGLCRPTLAANDDATSEMERLLGAWTCSGSVDGSTSTEAYRRLNDTTLEVSRVVHTAAVPASPVRERFTYDRAQGVWSLDAGKSRFYDAEHLEAGAWAGSDWVFAGAETAAGHKRPVRISYSSVFPDTFVRHHQTLIGGHWNADSAFLCRRAPLDASYDDEVPPPENASPSDAQLTQSATTRGLANARPSASPAPQAATRVALGTASQPRVSDAGGVDRAYSLTHGIWDCKTFGGADATHTYTRRADGSIVLHNVLNIAKHAYAIDETYRFDGAKAEWTVATSGGAYAGVAGKWLTDKWAFSGDMPLEGRRVPVQMVYYSLGERAFRRDFTRVQDGAPATFAAETCVLR